MNRRGFLKSLGGAAIAAALPLPAVSESTFTPTWTEVSRRIYTDELGAAIGARYSELLALSLRQTKEELIAQIATRLYTEPRLEKLCRKLISGIGCDPTSLVATIPESRPETPVREPLTYTTVSRVLRGGSNSKMLDIPTQTFPSPTNESDYIEAR
jgi:hypothetical protein